MLKRLLPTSVQAQLHGPRRFDEIQREIADLRSIVEEQHRVLLSLNHTLVFGGETGLPLLVDVVDRIRTDADTTIGALHAMQRQIGLVTNRIDEIASRIDQTNPVRDA